MKVLNRNRYFLRVFRCEACAPLFSACWLRSRLSGCMRTIRAGRCHASREAISIPWLMARSYGAAPLSRSPMPQRPCRSTYDAAYQLDAGDKLRVVVYGQEGLTNTYAIDAGGSITMPLIGSVPARGRTPAGLASEITGQAAQRLHPRSLGGGGDRILPAVLHPRRSRGPRPISLRAQHERRKRGGDCRRLLAARQARPRHPDPHRRLRFIAAIVVPLGTPLGPGDTVLVGERWF